jgi:4-amino-4-deoxy-L-arabinose transferase-like glycosyltransferase
LTARPWRRWDARYGVALALLLGVALALRLWGIRSGLPWVYNVDEGDHFVPEALRMLHGNLEPRSAGGSAYLANPPAFTYLIAAAYELWFGGLAAAGHVYRSRDPAEVWVVARAVSALLGTLAVWLLYGAGRRLFDRATGLLAAATMAVAFLPVLYSKLALNDVPALVGVCLSLWGSAAVLRDGHRRGYAVAGVGLGVAAATKYTSGIVVLALLAAATARGLGGLDGSRGAGARRHAAAGAAIAGLAAIAAFIALNPYSVADWHAFTHAISHQSSESAQTGKLGLTHGGGIVYYLWSLTWGVGWAPAMIALVGALALTALDRWAAAMLVPTTVAYLVFMGLQGRYFGRWVLPIVPIVCLLAAFAALAGARALARGSRGTQAALVGAFAIGLCVQGVIDSVHAGVVNSRADTRAAALAYLTERFRPHTRIVVEPIAPAHWGGRFSGFPALLSHRGRGGRLRIYAGKPVTLEDYERTLSPALIGLYERGDFCVVVTGSTEEGRALVDPGAVPAAVAYYRALASQGTLLFSASPYAVDATPVAFNFDWSFDYYPSAYEQPGPSLAIYQLHGGRCASRPPLRRASG